MGKERDVKPTSRISRCCLDVYLGLSTLLCLAMFYSYGCTGVVLPGCSTNGQCPACRECQGGACVARAGCDVDDPEPASEPCGNGTLDTGETCDGDCPTTCDGDCPTTCDDELACTVDTGSGSSATCDLACEHTAITVCAGGDGCCPSGCVHDTDADCPKDCGNGAVDLGETCDGNCPLSCDDGNACTGDVMTGSATTCDAVCTSTQITACKDGDGCCPTGCANASDSDCACTRVDYGGNVPAAAKSACSGKVDNAVCTYAVSGACQTAPNGGLACAEPPPPPPQQALDACGPNTGGYPGKGCTYTAGDGSSVSGTCNGPPGNPLACVPTPPPPNPLSSAACAGAVANAACGFNVNGRCLSGACTPCQ
jgi:hypothetical protein